MSTPTTKMLARATQQLAQCARQQNGAKILARSFGHRVSMVLKDDVKNLGNRGDVVSVKAGYARNYLYPEKLAVYATEANVAKFKVDKESVDEAALEKERQLKQIIQRLTSVEVVFKRHTAAKTELTLHSSVTAENISDMLEKQHGIIVGVARIQLPTPIKTLGSHVVKVRVDDEIENEVAAEAATAEAEAGEEKAANKGPSKKKEVKLNMSMAPMPTRLLCIGASRDIRWCCDSAIAQLKMPRTTTLKKKKTATAAATTEYVEFRGKRITRFEMRVYELISTIPVGKVSTYGGVAKALNSGPRSVGQALRKNPFAPEVPCHRIVAATLEIGGFRGSTGEKSSDIQDKRQLLGDEGVRFTQDKKVCITGDIFFRLYHSNVLCGDQIEPSCVHVF
ncbi:TPA: hypothetical protein N0F65_001878 [Lagenidium giganteum]|uniref:Methylated-DNA--protein-cysteine methyltransferase n=1 Tax=Lagenidium giganteum TaxID=4803 RepID=A0AAV2Z1H3_9STRA|nr:TPA: hypothetical protein N0F65_001878 [Lagenidium giganteum]